MEGSVSTATMLEAMEQIQTEWKPEGWGTGKT
jgi:hypothetical protein